MRANRTRAVDRGWRRRGFLLAGVAALLLAMCQRMQASTVVLYLKNGDRISGTLVSEDNTRVVVSTAWSQALAVPTDQIERFERGTRPPVAKLTPPPGGQATNSAGLTNLLPRMPVVGAAPAPGAHPEAPKPHKDWSGEGRIGANFLYGVNSQENYYGHLKLAYQHPYVSDPTEFVRSSMEYTGEYGWTKTLTGTNDSKVLSANQMNGTSKTDVDIGKRFYLYYIGAAGYDEVQKIDLEYEMGPGLGYHLIARTNLTLNVEIGPDYQVQYRSDETSTYDMYYRLAEYITWNLRPHLSLIEKVEYFRHYDSDQYRARLEGTLSYALWQNITLNLTALDLYDTQPASSVPNNDLQIRSSVGVKF